MEAIGRGIETGVDRARLFIQPRRQTGVIGGLVDQVSPAKIVEKHVAKVEGGVWKGEGENDDASPDDDTASRRNAKCYRKTTPNNVRLPHSPLAPEIVAGERVLKAPIEFRFGEHFQDLLGKFQVVAGCDFDIQRGAGHDRNRSPQPFD